MNLAFKRKTNRHQVPAPTPAAEYNPYLAARREWDERYGDQITRAKNWRTMAALSGLVSLLATSGMIWMSVRSHVVPFVVLVDNLSRPIASGIAEQATRVPPASPRSERLRQMASILQQPSVPNADTVGQNDPLFTMSLLRNEEAMTQ